MTHLFGAATRLQSERSRRRRAARAEGAELMKRAMAAGMVASMLVVAMATTVGAQTPVPGATITIVHGVRGLVADVYLDGTLILETFQPERTTAPVPIAPGPHVVEVHVSGAPAGSPPALTWPVDVAPDDRISAVVHLDAAGTPTVTRYDDDLSQIAAGQSRVAVRHAAAAGPVDVRLADQVLATNLANAQETVSSVPPAAAPLVVTATGSATPLAPPQEVTAAEGSALFLYLVGAQAEGTLGWVAQRVDGLQSVPVKVPTGDSGLAAPADELPIGSLSVVAASLLVTMVAGWLVLAAAAPPRSRPGVSARLVIALVALTVLVAACGRAPMSWSSPPRVSGACARRLRRPRVAAVEPPSRAGTERAAAAPTTAATTDRAPEHRGDGAGTARRPGPTGRGRADAIAIEGVAIAGPVVPVGVDAGTGELEVPPVANVVGWYRHGPTPGAEGSAVLAGHVDWHGEIGVFFHLSRVEPGSVVVVGYADGTQRRFTVVERRLIAKPELPVEEVFARTGPPALVLITCGGDFDRSIRRYRSNVVVTACPRPERPGAGFRRRSSCPSARRGRRRGEQVEQLAAGRPGRSGRLGGENRLGVPRPLHDGRIVEHRSGRLEQVHAPQRGATQHRVAGRAGEDAADELLAIHLLPIPRRDLLAAPLVAPGAIHRGGLPVDAVGLVADRFVVGESHGSGVAGMLLRRLHRGEGVGEGHRRPPAVDRVRGAERIANGQEVEDERASVDDEVPAHVLVTAHELHVGERHAVGRVGPRRATRGKAAISGSQAQVCRTALKASSSLPTNTASP